jgi:hypothetical protein
LALASERRAFKKVRYHYSHPTGAKGRARSPLPSSRAAGHAHVIVNPGGTNERFDRAHLQKATIVQWSDTIFDALVQGKADLMITDAVEAGGRAKLHPGVLCPVHPKAPFDHSELAYWMPRDPISTAYVNQWPNLLDKYLPHA